MHAAYQATWRRASTVGVGLGLIIGVVIAPPLHSLAPLLAGPVIGLILGWLATLVIVGDHIRAVTKLAGRDDNELLGPTYTRTFELAVPCTTAFRLCKDLLTILGGAATLIDHLGDGEGEIQAKLTTQAYRYYAVDLIRFTLYALGPDSAQIVVTCQPAAPEFDRGRNLGTMRRIERFFAAVEGVSQTSGEPIPKW